jgi:glutathione reductase (NADPH)
MFTPALEHAVMTSQTFDLIVLGAGSGGLGTALRAARHGAHVALLDPGYLGGTCVNVGCIPKKAMWYAAELAQAQAMALDYGFASQPGKLDWNVFVGHRQRYIENIHASYQRALDETGVSLIAAEGQLLSANTVVADGLELSAPHVVIATGARPHRLSIPGFDLGMVSDGFFDLRDCPRRTAIVGGGYIAVEFAGVLRALGGEVDLCVRNRLLGGFDVEMGEELGVAMRTQGIHIHTDSKIVGAHKADGKIYLDGENGQIPGAYDTLIWAIGRQPNSERLGLQGLGVVTNQHGHILVDDKQNTNVEGIYAVGDVTDRKALTPVAVAAGRCLADRLFGNKPEAKLDYNNIPSVVFSHPPLATVGLSEEEAHEQHGGEVHVYRQAFRPMQLALSNHPMKTHMKVICVGKDERVVGIHILGTCADEMLQGFAVAMKMGMRKADLDTTVAIHPSSAEEMVLMRARPLA